MLAILFAHAVATALAPLLVYRWGRMAFYPLSLVPLGSLVWVALNWPGPGQARSIDVSWVPELSMDITLRFDALAAIMSVLVLGIGALVLFYCADYFHHHDGHTEKRLPSFAAELVAFAGAMFGLVVSDNMLVLYVFWELTTVLSFLLVGHYAERVTSRRAAVQALLVTTAGGLAMLVGIVVLGTISGTYLLSELIAAPPSGLAASVGIVLILVGALAKSAIVPMHFWLPGAMAAPTPVSAYLHAAAMVKAGRLPDRADDAGIRRLAAVAADGGHPRRADRAARRLARGPRIRPEADPGVRHREPTRPDHRDGRRGWQRSDAGRAGRAVRARHVQGRAVHGRRHHRPRHRHP